MINLGVIANQKSAPPMATQWVFMYSQSSTPYPSEYAILITGVVASDPEQGGNVLSGNGYYPYNYEVGTIAVIHDGDYYFYEAQ